MGYRRTMRPRRRSVRKLHRRAPTRPCSGCTRCRPKPRHHTDHRSCRRAPTRRYWCCTKWRRNTNTDTDNRSGSVRARSPADSSNRCRRRRRLLQRIPSCTRRYSRTSRWSALQRRRAHRCNDRAGCSGESYKPPSVRCRRAPMRP